MHADCDCTFLLKGCDGVDDEPVDVRGRHGSDVGRRKVLCRLDSRRTRLQEGSDGIGLGRADDEGCHPLALGQGVEQAAEQVVAVYKIVVVHHDRDVDWSRAIQQAEILCHNTIIRDTVVY